MSDILPLEYKKKFVYIGHKYFFYSGKFSIHPRPYCFIMSIISLIFNYILTIYYMNKFIHGYIILPIILTILFLLQMIETLLAGLIDPGSFLPSKSDENSKSFDAKLMFASISNLNYSLKFCYTCNIVRDLRVYHCPDCGLCILRHDHHCPWLSTCIGLNNHKHFISLIIINFFYFGYTSYIYLKIGFTMIDIDFKVVDLLLILFLILMNLCFLSFHVVLIYNHINYICTGQTTRERRKRKRKGGENPFQLPSGFANAKEFCICPMRYKLRINYNKYASKFLDTNILISDYLSGSYKITKDKKVISKTLIDKGFSYPSDLLIELPSKNYESDEEETAQSIKIDDDINNNKNEILTKAENIK